MKTMIGPSTPAQLSDVRVTLRVDDAEMKALVTRVYKLYNRVHFKLQLHNEACMHPLVLIV
jgi:hypothetical protein